MRFAITRRILDVLSRCPEVDLSITTKSTLITRDIDILQRIDRRGRLTVQITLLTLNPAITRIVERRTPPPRLRLETIRALHAAGIEVGLFVMPLLPGITDSPDEMRALLRAAKEAGAGYAVGDPLRLPGPSWETFEPVLREHFPHLLKTYRTIRSDGDGTAKDWARPALEKFDAIRSSVGLRRDSASGDPGALSLAGSGWLFDPPSGFDRTAGTGRPKSNPAATDYVRSG